MRRILIIAVVVAQIAALAYMAGERECVLRTGRIMYLRTAPVDPQDPMRGDYIRLNYEIATVPRALCRDGVPAWFDVKNFEYSSEFRDRRVYAQVRLDREGVAEVISLSDREPAAGIYLRGRINAVHARSLDVRFGVEAFFMQQGKAKAFENTMRNEKAGVPLNMEIAVGPSGLAVLKGYRWEPLGITLTLDRRPQPPSNDRSRERPGLRGVTVEIKNHGTAPVAIVDGPGRGAFRLVPSRAAWATDDSAWVWVGENVAAPKPAPDQVKVLAPGENCRVHFDFTASEWFVHKVDAKKAAGPPVSLETLGQDWGASFRIEYAPPSAEECAGLPHADLIRHAGLRSRVFSPAGGAD